MRFVRKLALLTVMAAAALALTASSASAVEVSTEVGGPTNPDVHCPAVTPATHGVGSGGCLVRADSVGQVELGSPAGMILCNNSFEARINEAGAGYIYTKTLTNCNIPTAPCQEAAGQDTWSVTMDTVNLLEAHFCVVVGGALTAECNLDVDVSTQVDHNPVVFQTGAGTPPPHRNCTQAGLSVAGRWNQVIDASHPALEIR